MRAQRFIYTVGGNPNSSGLDFVAAVVTVDNPTNQHLFFDAPTSQYVPARTMGAVLLVMNELAGFRWQAPAGITQPPIDNTTAFATIVYTDVFLPLSPGVGILGARVSYQDRTPTTVLMSYAASLAPHVATTRVSYTIPTGRTAHLGAYQLKTESQGGYAAVGVFIETYIYLTTAAGSTIVLKDAYLYRYNADGSLDELDAVLDSFVNAGDTVQIVTRDAGAGGSSYHFAALGLLTFDA